MDTLAEIRRFFRNNPRMVFVVVLGLIATGGVIWLAYGGASLEIGKFFAAAPHTASVLSVTCGTTQNVLTWTLPADHDSNSIIRNVDGGDGAFIAPNLAANVTTYTDTNVSAGHTYSYRHKAFADAASNIVTCPASTPTPTPILTPSPTPSPTPLPSPTPTPIPVVPSAVLCAPDSQIVVPGQVAQLQAIGGSGVYQWSITGGGVIQNGGNETIGVSYSTIGTKTVRVSSAGLSAACTVIVQAVVPAPPVGTGLTVEKLASNMSHGDVMPIDALTVTQGTVVQFVINVTSVTTSPLTNIVVRDTVPFGMSYQAGSTYVEGQPIIVETITTSGLPLGTLQAGDRFTVRWSAVADRTDQLSVGYHPANPQVQVSADGVSVVDGVSLQIQGTGAAVGIGTVQTGPSDAVVFALITAAGLTLLYGAHTRSSGFHRREAKRVSQDQKPLDFRS